MVDESNVDDEQVLLEMSCSHPQLAHIDRAKAKSWIELSHTKPGLYTRVTKFVHWMTEPPTP